MNKIKKIAILMLSLSLVLTLGFGVFADSSKARENKKNSNNCEGDKCVVLVDKSYGEALNELGLIKGDGKSLNELGKLKRQEMIVIMNRLTSTKDEFENFIAPETPSFKDVPKTHWAYKDIEFALKNNITEGINKNKFGLDLNINAKQASLFLVRALGYENDTVNGRKIKYKDAYEIVKKELGLKGENVKDDGAEISRADIFEMMFKSLGQNNANGNKFGSKVLGNAEALNSVYEAAGDLRVNLVNKESWFKVMKRDGLETDPNVSVFDYKKYGRDNKKGDNESEEGRKKREEKHEGKHDADNSVMRFSLNLFKQSLEKENEKDNGKKNVLVSPISILSAMTMCENGADGQTLNQMKTVFGLNLKESNEYFKNYMDKLLNEKTCKINIANSIWINDINGIKIKDDFIKTNKENLKAEVSKEVFNKATTEKINSWVDKNTSSMIKNIIDKVDESAIMYLVNALSFDAEWNKIYNEYAVKEEEFTNEDGSKSKFDIMYSEEGDYIVDKYARGAIKYYKGGKYAFVALVPNDGMSVDEYAKTLSAERLNKVLSNPAKRTVTLGLPKFKLEYGCLLNDTLTDMGIEDAFNSGKANFSKMSDAPLFISRAIHKTFIEVNEKGTKAGAATAIEMKLTSMPPQEPVELIINKPFMYMIIDTENNAPLFIGTVKNIDEAKIK